MKPLFIFYFILFLNLCKFSYYASIPNNLKKLLCKNNPNFRFCKEEINNNGGLDLEYKRLICKYRYELEICKHQKEFPLIEGATNSQTFFTQKIQPLYYPKINFKNSEVDMDQRTFKSLNDEEDIEGSGEIPSQTLKTNDFPTSLQPWDI